MQDSEGKKLVNTKGGWRMVFADKNLKSPFELDEPRWQNDKEHSVCGKCATGFSITNRRHHCRRCGKIFCGQCCSRKISLPRLAFVDPQRVCKDCTPLALQEKGFYEKHIRYLQNGAKVTIDDTDPLVFLCQLDPRTHRELLFRCFDDSHTAAHDPVALANIISMQTFTNDSESSSECSVKMNGIILKYKKDDETEQIKICAHNGNMESVAFLNFLYEAIKMIFDAP